MRLCEVFPNRDDTNAVAVEMSMFEFFCCLLSNVGCFVFAVFGCCFVLVGNCRNVNCTVPK